MLERDGGKRDPASRSATSWARRGRNYWEIAGRLTVEGHANVGEFAAKPREAVASEQHFYRRITFELSGRQRQDARPGLVKMYRVPPARAWWPAVGTPLERGVRPHLGTALRSVRT
jgi:hypothetical protein